MKQHHWTVLLWHVRTATWWVAPSKRGRWLHKDRGWDARPGNLLGMDGRIPLTGRCWCFTVSYQ